MAQEKDVFLCHASEDKKDIIRPIAEALGQAGITYWFDEAEIIWGDSIIKKVQEGLRISRYVIVVLSESFISKPYPQHELDATLNIEASTGEIRVLPLIAGTENIKKQILDMYPILASKKYESWDRDTQKIIQSLRSRLARKKASPSKASISDKENAHDIPIPKIKRKFSQREKDVFIKESFPIIKDFFKRGLKQLENSYTEIETDFTEVHNFKFICTIYLNGEVKNKCKIWLGGVMSSDSISYQEGSSISIEGDSSFNDWLTVTDENHELGFKTGPMSNIGRMSASDKSTLNPKEAASHFWKSFTKYLE